jgi:membrane protein YdbS with pleckstrin-like domain
VTYESRYRSRSFLSRLIGIVLIVWLVIGAIAAGQRHYYNSGDTNCASFATIAVTILAGPLNYVGANPKIHCKVPEPSK